MARKQLIKPQSCGKFPGSAIRASQRWYWYIEHSTVAAFFNAYLIGAINFFPLPKHKKPCPCLMDRILSRPFYANFRLIEVIFLDSFEKITKNKKKYIEYPKMEWILSNCTKPELETVNCARYKFDWYMTDTYSI